MSRSLSLSLATSASELKTMQRELAFQRVYDEGRWRLGADGGACGSGWSAVHKVRGTLGRSVVWRRCTRLRGGWHAHAPRSRV